MAIVFENFKLISADDIAGQSMPCQKIDLRTGQVSPSDELVLYTPSDLKKLARAKKMGYLEVLRAFREVALDTKTGAGVYVPL